MKTLKVSVMLGLTSATLIFVGAEGKAYVPNSNAKLSETEGKTLLAAHDRYGNWHWSDGTIEPCYNWDTGYYC